MADAAEIKAAAGADEATARRNLRRAVVASTVGTTIEWYDFFLYGFASATVIGPLYFPSSHPLTSTLVAFATYFGGFAARPIGAVIFGHYGDRVGRKASLIATLLTMGLATVLVGVVPTASSIGIWGGIVLTVLRVIQGIGVGGEWGGSVLMSIEWGHRGRRGFIASWPQWGVPSGLALSIGALAAMRAIAGAQGFMAWGWRVPFLISIVLVGVGLWVRLGILETPVFAHLKEQRQVVRAPVLEVLRLQWREVVLTALIRTGQQAPFYIFTTFVLTYGTGVLKFSDQTMFNYVLIASVVSMVTIPLWGYVSDVVGRKRLYLVGAALMVIFSFVYFFLLDSQVPGLVLLAIVLSLAIHDMQYGPLGAITAEAFTGRLRYSGASLGYQLASITAGGPAPLIATALLARFGGSLPIAVYMAACAVISVIAVALLANRERQDMSVEYADVGAKPAV
ncbi:MAG: MHS family MFS transporter [Streptosporangiales bacterium]|nr:MHS family MFS transporter [Streptosporangiales bacterium]MBO0889390.1 MHS family MFS transporter [Acidothermales bacterium]